MAAPLRLYLICSLAFFVSKPLAQAISKRSGNDIAEITITNPDGSKTLTPEALEEIEGGVPARVFGRDRLLRAAVNNDQLNREIDAVLPKALFVLLAGLRAPDHGRLAPPPATLSGAPLCFTAPSRGLVWCVCRFDDTAGGLHVRTDHCGDQSVGSRLCRGVWSARRPPHLRRFVADDDCEGDAVTVVYGFCLFVVSLSLLAYVLTRM